MVKRWAPTYQGGSMRRWYYASSLRPVWITRMGAQSLVRPHHVGIPKVVEAIFIWCHQWIATFDCDLNIDLDIVAMTI